MPKKVFEYPDEERLEVLILANSPCTPTEILELEKIPIRPDTLETIKKRMDWLCNQGKVKKKRVAQGNIYWHSKIEDFKKRVVLKLTKKIISVPGDHIE
ncbi:MAG: hypothetical protein ACP5O8_02895 [Candidatus Aenigmatarchaeota archaeon]